MSTLDQSIEAFRNDVPAIPIDAGGPPQGLGPERTARGGDVSTTTAMTESAHAVDVDEFLASLADTGSCCAEVGLGGFFPNLSRDDLDETR